MQPKLLQQSFNQHHFQKVKRLQKEFATRNAFGAKGFFEARKDPTMAFVQSVSRKQVGSMNRMNLKIAAIADKGDR